MAFFDNLCCAMPMPDPMPDYITHAAYDLETGELVWAFDSGVAHNVGCLGPGGFWTFCGSLGTDEIIILDPATGQVVERVEWFRDTRIYHARSDQGGAVTVAEGGDPTTAFAAITGVELTDIRFTRSPKFPVFSNLYWEAAGDNAAFTDLVVVAGVPNQMYWGIEGASGAYENDSNSLVDGPWTVGPDMRAHEVMPGGGVCTGVRWNTGTPGAKAASAVFANADDAATPNTFEDFQYSVLTQYRGRILGSGQPFGSGQRRAYLGPGSLGPMPPGVDQHIFALGAGTADITGAYLRRNALNRGTLTQYVGLSASSLLAIWTQTAYVEGTVEGVDIKRGNFQTSGPFGPLVDVGPLRWLNCPFVCGIDETAFVSRSASVNLVGRGGFGSAAEIRKVGVGDLRDVWAKHGPTHTLGARRDENEFIFDDRLYVCCGGRIDSRNLSVACLPDTV
jgi:hypothetical protein